MDWVGCCTLMQRSIVIPVACCSSASFCSSTALCIYSHLSELERSNYCTPELSSVNLPEGCYLLILKEVKEALFSLFCKLQLCPIDCHHNSFLQAVGRLCKSLLITLLTVNDLWERERFVAAQLWASESCFVPWVLTRNIHSVASLSHHGEKVFLWCSLFSLIKSKKTGFNYSLAFVFLVVII